jgi:hypothetical protein
MIKKKVLIPVKSAYKVAAKESSSGLTCTSNAEEKKSCFYWKRL